MAAWRTGLSVSMARRMADRKCASLAGLWAKGASLVTTTRKSASGAISAAIAGVIDSKQIKVANR